MSKRNVNLDSLRLRAEAAISAATEAHLSSEATPGIVLDDLLHELRVYQAELEMQNEELVESQARLVRTNAKYQSLFNDMPLPALLCDESGFVAEANTAAQKLLGLGAKDIQQRYAFAQFVSISSRFAVDHAIAGGAETAIRAEVRNIRTKAELPCALYISDVDGGEHEPVYRQILLVDRSSEVALERAKIDAEVASRAKSTFLANMSHELRTPFNGVLGMLSLARKRMTDPAGLSQLDTAATSAKRLLAIVDDILDLAKVESGKLVLETVPFELTALLSQVRSVCSPLAEAKELRFECDLDAELRSMYLNGDPTRLAQILNNLVGNAVKFSESGCVRVRVAALRSDDLTACLRFEVSDQGSGVPHEIRDRLFTPFEQGDASTTRRHGGTGLGLAICKRLVELMGGDIGVESEVGTGSTFWFTVRFDRAPHPVAVAGEDASATDVEMCLGKEFGGATILVVEDEPVNQEVVRALLEGVGLVVETAEDGVEALARSKARHFDLILMDLQLPRLNGIEATVGIRNHSLNRTTPILALTANAFEEDRKLCLAAGMNEHISKPVVSGRLYRSVLNWLRKHRAADSRSPAG